MKNMPLMDALGSLTFRVVGGVGAMPANLERGMELNGFEQAPSRVGPAQDAGFDSILKPQLAVAPQGRNPASNFPALTG